MHHQSPHSIQRKWKELQTQSICVLLCSSWVFCLTSTLNIKEKDIHIMVQLNDYTPLFSISVCLLGFRTSLRNMTGKTVSFSNLVFLLKQRDWLNHCGQARNFRRVAWEGFVFGCRNLRESQDSAQQDVNLSSLISANNHSSSLQAQRININKMWLHYLKSVTRGRRIAFIQ